MKIQNIIIVFTLLASFHLFSQTKIEEEKLNVQKLQQVMGLNASGEETPTNAAIKSEENKEGCEPGALAKAFTREIKINNSSYNITRYIFTFPTSSGEFNSSQKDCVKYLANSLSKKSEFTSGKQVLSVIGYTSSKGTSEASGGFEGNLALSLKRAESLKTSIGISEIKAVGMGETNLLDSSFNKLAVPYKAKSYDNQSKNDISLAEGESAENSQRCELVLFDKLPADFFNEPPFLFPPYSWKFDWSPDYVGTQVKKSYNEKVKKSNIEYDYKLIPTPPNGEVEYFNYVDSQKFYCRYLQWHKFTSANKNWGDSYYCQKYPSSAIFKKNINEEVLKAWVTFFKSGYGGNVKSITVIGHAGCETQTKEASLQDTSHQVDWYETEIVGFPEGYTQFNRQILTELRAKVVKEQLEKMNLGVPILVEGKGCQGKSNTTVELKLNK